MNQARKVARSSGETVLLILILRRRSAASPPSGCTRHWQPERDQFRSAALGTGNHCEHNLAAVYQVRHGAAAET
jgi:hypothetical protein